MDSAYFWDVVRRSLGLLPNESLDPRRALGELAIDEAALFRIVLDLQAANACFEIPDQMDVAGASLDDLCYYFQVMGPGHVRESLEGEP